MKNADKIRSMTVEELAKIICCQDLKHGNDCFKTSCIDCTIEWLNKEAEQTMLETKKQKTMMEDFFEKFPDAPRLEDGVPFACAGAIYDSGDKCPQKSSITCVECWSRPVPPQHECYKNVTLIIEYDKNGKPIISWVRQEDTERIGYKEAMKRVMKVKTNE